MQIYNCLNLIFRTNVLCLKFLFEYIQKSKYINMTFNSRASFLFRKIKQKKSATNATFSNAFVSILMKAGNS